MQDDDNFPPAHASFRKNFDDFLKEKLLPTIAVHRYVSRLCIRVWAVQSQSCKSKQARATSRIEGKCNGGPNYSTPEHFYGGPLGRVVLVTIAQSHLYSVPGTAVQILVLRRLPSCWHSISLSWDPLTEARGHSRSFALGIRSYTHNISSCYFESRLPYSAPCT